MNNPKHLKNHYDGILATEQQKTMYWKANERERTRWYFLKASQLEEILTQEGNKVADAFEEGGLDQALDVIEKDTTWEQWFTRTYTEIIADFGQQEWDKFRRVKSIRQRMETKEGENPEGDFFNPWSALIQAFIKRTTSTKIKLIKQFNKAQVKKVVEDARKDPEETLTVDQIARKIKSNYDEQTKYRKYRIARTEVVGASSSGSYHAGQQANERYGIEFKRKWVSSRDKRVRDSHNHMDGEIVGMKEHFSNGLLFPADMDADKPSETIQCRCTVANILDM